MAELTLNEGRKIGLHPIEMFGRTMPPALLSMTSGRGDNEKAHLVLMEDDELRWLRDQIDVALGEEKS